MNIGILGAGSVGGTLGTRWAANGHKVVFASREPESQKSRELVANAGANASSGSNREAAAEADVVLVATPWEAAEEALRSAGDLKGKTVIDATNPLLPDLSGLAVGCNDSAAERIAKAVPDAKVVKAFNSVGFNIMADPHFESGRVAMFYCGDDAGAKATVAGLISELGFEAVDAGPLRQARVIEPFAMLWISLAYQAGLGREIAFQLLRR